MVIKLDTYDRRLLYELDKNARMPDTRLAKLIGRSKESVRYRIKKLQSSGVIQGFSLWLDLAIIGYSSAKIYLNLANNPSKKKKFIDYVKNDKRLFWLGVAEGAWNVGLTYFVRTNREFFDLKNRLFSEFTDLIIESHTGVLVNVNISDKTFLYDTGATWKVMFNRLENYQLEDVEKKILKELYINSRINVVEIAMKHNTSIDIVRHRIKKLEDKGVIFKYHANIDFNKLGYEFFKTFLYFKNLTKEDETRLMMYCQANPKIIHLVKQISPWDIELEIMCESYHDYNHIIADITQEFSTIINKVETAIMGEDYIFPSDTLIFE